MGKQASKQARTFRAAAGSAPATLLRRVKDSRLSSSAACPPQPSPPFFISPNHHHWNNMFLVIIPSELMHPPSLLDGHNHHLNPLTLWSLSGRQGTILAWVSWSLSPNSGHTNLWPVTWASWQLVHTCTIFLCSLDDQFRGPNMKEKGHLAVREIWLKTRSVGHQPEPK